MQVTGSNLISSISKPIPNIVIRDEQDIYNILTNREKLECLFQEYLEKNQLEQQIVCCDENTPCVSNNNNNNKIVSSTTITTT